MELVYENCWALTLRKKMEHETHKGGAFFPLLTRRVPPAPSIDEICGAEWQRIPVDRVPLACSRFTKQGKEGWVWNGDDELITGTDFGFRIPF